MSQTWMNDTGFQTITWGDPVFAQLFGTSAGISGDMPAQQAYDAATTWPETAPISLQTLLAMSPAIDTGSGVDVSAVPAVTSGPATVPSPTDPGAQAAQNWLTRLQNALSPAPANGVAPGDVGAQAAANLFHGPGAQKSSPSSGCASWDLSCNAQQITSNGITYAGLIILAIVLLALGTWAVIK